MHLFLILQSQFYSLVTPHIFTSRSPQPPGFSLRLQQCEDVSLSAWPPHISSPVDHLSLLASLSDSNSVRMSPSLTGPFTLRMMDRLESSKNSTRTWVA